jgi:hypothetical protein
LAGKVFDAFAGDFGIEVEVAHLPRRQAGVDAFADAGELPHRERGVVADVVDFVAADLLIAVDEFASVVGETRLPARGTQMLVYSSGTVSIATK